jgi:O-antigen ligase
MSFQLILLNPASEGKNRVAIWVFVNILIMAILVIQTLYFSVNEISSVLGALKLIFAICVVGFLVFDTVLNYGIEKNLVIWFAAGSASAAVSSIFDFGSPSISAGGLMRSGGLAGHPVGLAITCGTAIALLVQILVPELTKRLKLFLLLLITGNFLGIYESLGVTGALIVLIGISVGIVYSTPSLARQFMQILIAGTILLVFVNSDFGGSLLGRLQGAFSPQHGISSSSGQLNGSTVEIRLLTWQYSLGRILEHPILGNGFDESGQYSVGQVATHNYFLLMWQTGGILAFLISLCIGFSGLWALYKLWKLKTIYVNSRIAAVAISTTLFGALSSPALYGRQLYFIIALGLGSTMAGLKLQK